MMAPDQSDHHEGAAMQANGIADITRDTVLTITLSGTENEVEIVASALGAVAYLLDNDNDDPTLRYLAKAVNTTNTSTIPTAALLDSLSCRLDEMLGVAASATKTATVTL